MKSWLELRILYHFSVPQKPPYPQATSEKASSNHVTCLILPSISARESMVILSAIERRQDLNNDLPQNILNLVQYHHGRFFHLMLPSALDHCLRAQ